MKFNIKEIKKYIEENPSAKIFFGCDSQKISKRKKHQNKDSRKRVRFITVVVIYQKDKNKIFWDMSYEDDYDSKPSQPRLRLMNEVYKVSEIITEIQDLLDEREWECHLDINPRIGTGSNCAFHQAVGYIKGVHGITPIVKPDAFCSSTIADHIVRIGNYK